MKTIQLNGIGLTLYQVTKKDDRPFIKSHLDEIYKVLLGAYQHIGSCSIYKNPKELLSKAGAYKIVMQDDKIFAVATYRYFPDYNSYKCILIGRNYELDKAIGKDAVQWIIKSDIVNWKNLYWIEAYDAVAHWQEKYGAIKIPIQYVTSILRINEDDIIFSDDPYVYKRKIAGFTEFKPKIMFGFPSKAMLDKMMSDDMIANQDKHIQYLLDGNVYNKLLESVEYFSRYEALMNVFYYIEDSYNEANMFRNITPETAIVISKAYQEAIKLSKSPELDEYRKEDLEVYAQSVKEIVLNASIIIPHKMFASKNLEEPNYTIS